MKLYADILATVVMVLPTKTQVLSKPTETKTAVLYGGKMTNQVGVMWLRSSITASFLASLFCLYSEAAAHLCNNYWVTEAAPPSMDDLRHFDVAVLNWLPPVKHRCLNPSWILAMWLYIRRQR